MKVKNESEVAQSCLTLSDPMDCSLPGSSIHGIFQARVLEWGAIAFSVLVCYPTLTPHSHSLLSHSPSPWQPQGHFVSLWLLSVPSCKWNHAAFCHALVYIPYHQCVRVPVCPHPCQTFFSFFFPPVVSLLIHRWYLLLVLICISLMISDDENLFLC